MYIFRPHLQRSSVQFRKAPLSSPSWTTHSTCRDSDQGSHVLIKHRIRDCQWQNDLYIRSSYYPVCVCVCERERERNTKASPAFLSDDNKLGIALTVGLGRRRSRRRACPSNSAKFRRDSTGCRLRHKSWKRCTHRAHVWACHERHTAHRHAHS